MNNAGTRERLLNDNPLKLFFSLSLPAIGGMLAQALYTLMDGIYVGQMVGPTEMGAVALGFPLTLINTGLAQLIGIGSSSLMSRAIGRNDEKTKDKIMGNLLFLNMIAGLLVSFIGLTFTEQMVGFTGASGQLRELAVKYLRIYYCGTLFQLFADSSNMVLRGAGKIKLAMSLMAFGSIINIILDPIFILLLKPYGLGVEAVAIATILSHALATIATFFVYIKGKTGIKFGRPKFSRELTPEVLTIGLSACLLQVLILIQQTTVYRMESIYGNDRWQLIFSAALNVQTFAYIPLWGISQAFQPAVGTNFGAGKTKRVRDLTLIFISGASIVALCVATIIHIFAKDIMTLFITDPETVEMGVIYFRLYFTSYTFYGVLINTVSLFQATGKSIKALVLVTLRQVVIFIPLVILVPMIADLGIAGVWIAPVINDCIVLVIAIVLLALFLRKNAEKTVGT